MEGPSCWSCTKHWQHNLLKQPSFAAQQQVLGFQGSGFVPVFRAATKWCTTPRLRDWNPTVTAVGNKRCCWEWALPLDNLSDASSLPYHFQWQKIPWAKIEKQLPSYWWVGQKATLLTPNRCTDMQLFQKVSGEGFRGTFPEWRVAGSGGFRVWSSGSHGQFDWIITKWRCKAKPSKFWVEPIYFFLWAGSIGKASYVSAFAAIN